MKSLRDNDNKSYTNTLKSIQSDFLQRNSIILFLKDKNKNFSIIRKIKLKLIHQKNQRQKYQSR
jgi:hypothetical protein